MKVLFVTSEWPTPERPGDVPFLVEYLNALQAQGVEVSVFHFRGKANPLNYLKAWHQLRKLPEWKLAEILHAQWGQSGLLALFSRKPLVVTFHGSDLLGVVAADGHYSLTGKVLVKVSRWVARRADRCIVVSARLQSALPSSVQRADIIPMGVDLEKFRPMDQSAARQQLGLEAGTRYVLFVANPARPEKRFELARQAFQLACSSLDGEKIGLLPVWGEPPDRIPLFLNAGDVLLLTSTHEGSPVIVKEALACNRPVVAVDVGDVRERIGTVAGCHVCADDRPETIASAIIEALNCPTPVQGREAVQDLSWEAIAKKTIRIYEECLKRA